MSDNELFTVEYTVDDIIFRSKDNMFTIFTAKNVKIDDIHDKEVTSYIIKGTFETIAVNDSFSSLCCWDNNKKYGFQLDVKTSKVVIPSNENAICRFLSRFIKGVGKNTARMLVKQYGLDTLDKIKEGPHNLTIFQGIGPKKAEKLVKEVLKHDCIEQLSVYLFSKGVKKYYDVVTIYEAFENKALDMIMANPYVLCEKLGISWFSTADMIALNSNIDKDSDVRFSKIIQYYIYNRAYKNGDLYVCLSTLPDSLQDFMRKMQVLPTEVTMNRLKDVLHTMEQQSIVKQEKSATDTNIYLTKLYEDECCIADCVSLLCNLPSAHYEQSDYDRFYMEYKKETGISLGSQQKLAVVNAAEHSFSLLTGGAGTGKTQTVNAIIRFLQKKNKDIQIAMIAPTGRAAKRMSELTNMPASTIHKFLNLIGDDMKAFSSSEDNSIYDYVICDECSMIDAPLFAKLLKFACENNMKVLLVGDKEQLLSVGPGMIFRDLISPEINLPSVRLTQLFRQSATSQIYSNATKILNGTVEQDGLDMDMEKQDFFFLRTKDAAATKDLVIQSVIRLIELGTSKDDIMVLSSMRKTLLGVIAFNNALQTVLNPPSDSKKELVKGGYTFREGDRVMQEVNNYDLMIFNGDIGHIVSINPSDETVFIDFDGEIKEYDFSDMNDVTLAYAITVHKAQGSEFPCVIMPCDFMLRNLSRNLVYTSITRATNKFALIGSVDAFLTAVRMTDNMKRNTNLCEKISARKKSIPAA